MGVNGIYGLSGSGLDVESMVKVGMLSKQSEYEKMQQKYTVDEWKKTEYLSLYKEVQTFNASTLSKYKMSSNMNSRSAESADTSSVKATANANAATMTHYVEVQGLASSAYLIGTNSPTRLNTAADQKTQLSSVLFSSIAEGDTSDTVLVKLNATDDGTSYAMSDTAFSFSINDGVNGLMASDNSDVVVATATPDAAKGEYTVKVDSLGTGASSRGSYGLNVTEDSMLSKLINNSDIKTAIESNTGDAITFNFGDGTNTKEISFTYEELNDTVGNFIDKLNEKFDAAGLTLNASYITHTENSKTYGAISISNSQVGSDSAITLSVSDVDNALLSTGKVGSLASALFATGKIGNQQSSYTSTINIVSTQGTDATGVEVTDENGKSISYTVKGNTITAGGMTITAKAATTGMKITNDQSQVVSVTYGQLLEGFSFYDLTSQVNSMGLNVRLNYDSVQDRFSLYNKKSGENNQINIEIGTKDGSANAAKFFNQLGLKQSSNGEIVNEALSFAQGTTVTQAGVNASAKVDGIEYKNLDSNNLTVDGVTYNFQNVTTNKVPVTVTQDTESIVKNVQSFVDDYNALLTKLYKWYDEKPNSDYKPLTETQKSGMKEEQIEKWEEKAKAGMLYHDKTLGNIITELRSAVSGNVEGISGKYTNIFSIGISTTGLKGQLTLDKDKLNAALADDPDAVYNVFAKLDANDEFDSNGVAQRLGDVFQSAMKSVKSVAGTTADITEDSELNNLMRELQTKMSNFKKMMQAFETRLYKKYDAMESSLALLGSQLNYVTSAFQ